MTTYVTSGKVNAEKDVSMALLRYTSVSIRLKNTPNESVVVFITNISLRLSGFRAILAGMETQRDICAVTESSERREKRRKITKQNAPEWE